MQKLKYISQRKTVLFGQRNIQPVIGSRRLQFKIKSHAEALAQRESEGSVEAHAEGRVDDQLHSTGLVEKSLGDDGRLRRHIAKHGAAFERVLN